MSDGINDLTRNTGTVLRGDTQRGNTMPDPDAMLDALEMIGGASCADEFGFILDEWGRVRRDAIAQLRAALEQREHIAELAWERLSEDIEKLTMALTSAATSEGIPLGTTGYTGIFGLLLAKLRSSTRSEAETEVLRAAVYWYRGRVNSDGWRGNTPEEKELLEKACQSLPPDELARLGGAK